jgi:uncharacterized protein
LNDDAVPPDGDHAFVPLASLGRRAGAARPPDAAALASLRRHFDVLAAKMSAEERAAVAALLDLGPALSPLAELAAEPPAALLGAAEVAVVEELAGQEAGAGGRLGPNLAVIMKGTRICNLRCTYCRSWAEGPNESMSFDVLAHAIHGALSAPGVESVDFIWHGGETTLRPTSFYRKALWLQERFRRSGQKLTNDLRTNGTRLTSEWLDFIKLFRFRIGVSLDGPPEVHDRRRLDIAGRPTSALVREGIGKLRAHGIEHSVFVVVDDDVLALGAERLLQYLLELGVGEVALLNVVPDGEPDRVLPGDYLELRRYVDFLRELFALWWPQRAAGTSFREISDLIRRVQGQGGKFCVFDSNCMGTVLTIEPTGAIAVCDRFQGDADYRLGNVLDCRMADLPAAANLTRAHAAAGAGIERTSNCAWFDTCQGGCPHDRYVRLHRGGTDDGCCGWAPLIEDIASSLRSDGVQR